MEVDSASRTPWESDVSAKTRPYPIPRQSVPRRALRKSQPQERDTTSPEGACHSSWEMRHLDALKNQVPVLSCVIPVLS